MRKRTVVILVGLAAIGAAVLVLGRFGGFSTRTEPSAIERLVTRLARRLAVPPGSRDAVNPVPFSAGVWADARAHFADHCAACHGNDGRGDTELGRTLYPKAPDMRLAGTQRLTDGELYWIIENGVRLTGMPAWGDGSSNDQDTWKLVHFIRHLSELTGEQLKDMAALNPRSPSELEEERQDRDFLEGREPAAASSTPSPHVHSEHKEQP